MSTYYAEAILAQEPFPGSAVFADVPTTPGFGVVPDPETLARRRTDRRT